MSTTTTAMITSIVTTLSVTGVKRKYTEPPASLSTADLPASYPFGFTREEGPMTFQAHGGWPTHTLDFNIACEPVGQSTQPVNYALVQTMADNLSSALAASLPNAIGKAPLTWVIRGGNIQLEVAGIAYWGVSATITARG